MKSTTLSLLLAFSTMAVVSASSFVGNSGAAKAGESAAVPVSMAKPVSPSEIAGRTCLVPVTVVVDNHGSVMEAVVVGETGTAVQSAALDAVFRWKFSPATVNGQPVESKSTVAVRFDS